MATESIQDRPSLTWYDAPAPHEASSEAYFVLSSWLRAPESWLVYEGIHFFKIEKDLTSLSYLASGIYWLGISLLLLLPTALGSGLDWALGIRNQAILEQEGRGFNMSGSALKLAPENPRVLSLNFCSFPGNWNEFFGGIGRAGDVRIDEFIELLKREDPDVVCLQEIFDLGFAIRLKERLAQEGWGLSLFNAGANATLSMSSGLFIASRVEISKARYIPLQPWFDGRLPRGAFQVQIGEMDIFNTHLTPSCEDSNPQESEIASRSRQVEKIANYMQPGRPVVLVGDFNAQPRELDQVGSAIDAYPNSPATCTEFYTVQRDAHLNGKTADPTLLASTILDRLFADGLDVQPSVVLSFDLENLSKEPLSDHHALIADLTKAVTSLT